MSTVAQFRDAETIRQQRNLTTSQKRVNNQTLEGVVVNNIVKPAENNINEIYDTLIISKNLNYPKQLQTIKEKEMPTSALKKLSIVTLGFFGAMSAATFAILLAAKKKATLPNWKTLPEVPRNIALNEETHFATYAMIQNPNRKTILGALGVFSLTAAGAVGKNFVDGFKDIWVKKQEAKVQRNLQENLIEVETQSFSGKMQIQRKMLSEKAKMLEDYLGEKDTKTVQNPAFKNFIPFGSTNKQNPQKRNNDFLIGAGVTTLMGAFTYLSLKNIQKTAKHYDEYEKSMLEKIQNLIQNNKSTDAKTLSLIKNIMVSLQAKSDFIKKSLQSIPLEGKAKEDFINDVIVESGKITQEAAEAIAGKPGWKASFYSHVNDIRGHFYNWIVNFDSAILGCMFGGLSIISVLGYIGKQALDGIKQSEVIKANAQTELNLQKNLVEVELKNFYAKKSSVINPLMDEFLAQVQQGKNPNELKTMAENILMEIKNGPPFIYS